MSLRARLNEDPDAEYGVMTDSSNVNYGNNNNHITFKTLPRRFKVLFGVMAICLLILLISISAVASEKVRQFIFGVPDQQFDPNVIAQSFALRQLGADMDASRDMTADPCEDFYQYSCGGWVASTQLGNASSITKGFTDAAQVNSQYIRDILLEDWPIVSPFYDACMDVDTINARGFQPVLPFMNALNPDKSSISSVSELIGAFGWLRSNFRTGFLFTLSVRANSSDPRQAVLSMDAGGLTSSSWKYYVGPERQLLEAAVTAMFQAIGDSASDAARFASLAIGFEAKLVNITQRTVINRTVNGVERSTLEQRLHEALVEPLIKELDAPINVLQQYAPHIPFDVYFSGTGLSQTFNRSNGVLDINYRDLEGLRLIDAMVSNSSLSEMIAYARWRVLNYTSPYLPAKISEIRAETLGMLFDGAIGDSARYAKCAGMVVNSISDLFGRYFVERRLPQAARMTAKSMLTWIKQAFEANLPSVSWMDDPTRSLALEKAQAVAELVGGPENGNWSDYSEVWLTRATFWENVFEIESLSIREDWKKLTAPLSRFTFVMNPTLVNAAYSPSANSMNFPAGILNDPFFSFDYPMSVNMGRIGMVMGHELMHGFDNSGRMFDKDGYRREWWDPAVVKNFITATQCMIDQYDGVTVQGFNFSGTRTLGENIADNSGIKMAYIAFKQYESDLKSAGFVDPVPGPQETKNPLTSDQLFYWAHAQTWCTKATDASIQRQIREDVHSPGQARVWVPVTNQPEFAEAFQCKAGSRMNPVNKCVIY